MVVLPTRMDEFGTEYCELLAAAIVEDSELTADRVLANLRALEPLVQGFAVNQLVHALQTATRAERTGEDLDYDTLPLEHLEPMVREVFGRTPTTVL